MEHSEQAARKRHASLLEQASLDLFRHEYNHIRPQESLAMATPASCWRPSARAFQSTPPQRQYPPSMHVMHLSGEGQLSWSGRRWEISLHVCSCRRRGSIQGIGTHEQAIVTECPSNSGRV